MLLRDKKGIVLLLVFILIVALLGLVSSFLFIAMHQIRHTGGHLNDEKAFYAAQAALRKAVWRMRYDDPPENWDPNDPPPPSLPSPPNPPWGPQEESGAIDTGDKTTATYTVTVTLMREDVGAEKRDFTLVAEGTVLGITRTVEQQYQADLDRGEFLPIKDSWKEL